MIALVILVAYCRKKKECGCRRAKPRSRNGSRDVAIEGVQALDVVANSRDVLRAGMG